VRFRAGDADALGELYGRHVRGIHDFLARFVGDLSAAEDLAHTTFLRAWERRETLREPAKVRAWLYATAHSVALTHVTRRRSALPIQDEAAARIEDTTLGPEAAAVAQEVADLVWAAASSLEARQYAVIDLSVRHDFSTREIGQALGVSAVHASVLLHRAREALGRAVSQLLVAQQRDHCDRLAKLVPAGVLTLTSRQRSAVDHHMRRCEDCKQLGRWLTSPAQLLGALVPLPLPEALGAMGKLGLVAAARQPAGAAAGGHGGLPRRPDSRARWLAALGVLLLLAAGAVYLLRPAPVAHKSGVTVAPATPVVPAPQPPPPSAPPPTPQPTDTPPPPQPVPLAATPAPQPSPSPAQLAPVPVAAPAPPAPTPPPPPFAVVAVTVSGLGPGTCDISGLLDPDWECAFAVTIQVANATGGEAVSGTVTATSARTGESVSAPFQATVGAPGNSTVATTVALRFERCPQGTVEAAVPSPGPATSGSTGFGMCGLPLLTGAGATPQPSAAPARRS
jgi:RNA polymerase sigma factor (sigma-70 family)